MYDITYYSPALTQNQCHPFLSITLGFLPSFDSHIESFEMMVELEVYSSFRGGKRNFLDHMSAKNLIYLSDILQEIKVKDLDSSKE
jgi:hypothetical protein